MKSCPQCIKKLSDEFRFCSNCGYDFQTGGMGSQGETPTSRKFKVHKHQVRKVKQVKTPQQPEQMPPLQQEDNQELNQPVMYPTPIPQPTIPQPTIPQPPTPQPMIQQPTMPQPGAPLPSPNQYPQDPMTAAYPPQPYPTELDFKSKAEEDYSRGDYYAALDNYKLALMNDPGNFAMIMAKERLLEMLNHKDEAVEALDEALKVQPDNREIWKTKSRLLLLLYHEKGDSHYKKESDSADRMAGELKDKLISKGLCPSCNGIGNCLKCHGTGSCHECGGTGVYKGVVKCQFCTGTGKCDRCFGSAKCPDCKGSGKLELNECEHCSGNGLCAKCHGTGKHLIGHCKGCDGTGYCSHCKGKGKIANLPKPEKEE